MTPRFVFLGLGNPVMIMQVWDICVAVAALIPPELCPVLLH